MPVLPEHIARLGAGPGFGEFAQKLELCFTPIDGRHDISPAAPPIAAGRAWGVGDQQHSLSISPTSRCFITENVAMVTLATSARMTSKSSQPDLFELSTKTGQDHVTQSGLASSVDGVR